MPGTWWRHGIIYQVYPRSFQDSPRGGRWDGVGDLPGIQARLDHLVRLGVDAIWLSPIQPSPMADFGYDVADYRGVHALFGTLADFDALVAAAHARGLRLILDFVPNHSSDRHPWFAESRSSRGSARRNWYVWRDPAPDGGPPNNWMSHFGGPAWTLDAATGQFYLHSFLSAQPDLNWREPAVRQAMHDALRFWLDRGVDGFRVDVIWLLIKDAALRDNPPNPDWRPGQRDRDRLLSVHDADQPEVHEAVAELRAVLDEYPDRLLIGEIYLPIDRLVAYYGRNGRGAHLPFNFALILAPWRADTLARIIRDYEAALPPGAWPNWVLGNHDQSRLASRIGPDQARVAAMLLLTLRGTPTIYYGEEIGMRDVPIPPDRVQDPAERNEPGRGLGRDPERTPMRWNGAEGGGFTEGEPWLPLGDPGLNVAAQEGDPRSLLALYRRLIALRRTSPVLLAGSLDAVSVHGDVLAYERRSGALTLRIVLNLGDRPQPLPGAPGRVLAATDPDRVGVPSPMLQPNEGLVLQMPASETPDARDGARP